MRHLVIGECQKAPNFSAFHWLPHGCLITIGQHFVTTKVVHLPKRTETSLITESDQSRANHQLLQLCTVHTAWSDSDQAVRAVHSCKSWFFSHVEIKKKSGICNTFSTHVEQIFCAQFSLWSKRTGGAIEKFLKVTKFKFRFGHSQQFCENSTGFMKPKCMFY